MPQTNPAPVAAPSPEPHNIAAERAILHALLNGRDIQPVLLEALRADMFYTYVNNWLFAAMMDLHTSGSEIGVLTLMNRARERGELDVLRDGALAGEDYIRWLKSDKAAPDGSETLRGNARIVKEKATRRLMLKRAETLYHMAQDETTPAGVQITQFATDLNEIKPFDIDSAFVMAGSALSTHYDILSAKAQYKSWALTPWQTLTDRGIVLRDDTVVCVIGPTGSGKSAMLATWAEHSARNKIKTAYIHSEMSTQDVLDRAAVRRDKRIRFMELLKPNEISEVTWGILTDELEGGDPYDNNLFLWHAGAGITQETLLAAMTRLADDYGVQEFHIDYLNDFIPTQRKADNKTTAWRNMLVCVEDWCETHHARVIFAAQMNRDGGAYEIGLAASQKAHIYMEIKPVVSDVTVDYSYEGIAYKAHPGQKHPIHTVDIHKVRHGAGAGDCQLFFVGARYLWTDIPPGMLTQVSFAGYGDTETNATHTARSAKS